MSPQDKAIVLDTLREIAEVLDNYSDTVDGEDGEPMPNAAMSVQQKVDWAIWTLEKEAQ
jgi:hypothetical protein